jgi:glycosyltransferase involved in cell wall biosynthesis
VRGHREDLECNPLSSSSGQTVPASHAASPLVNVITPVFNGERYLRACIESVLAQTYDNWDYTIIDNCSTDGTMAIAQEYAESHPRVKVTSNDQFVGVVENHNRAFRSISRDAKYCKLVSADDWLYPECISRLVDFAERHPSVGVVGSYSVNDNGVRFGPPDDDLNKPARRRVSRARTLRPMLGEEVLGGRDATRSYLLGAMDHFFVPSTVLYRASMVRTTVDFFPGTAPSADLEACLNCLKESDLGFVHQILSFERVHDDMITAKLHEMNIVRLERLRILNERGSEFLTPDEQGRRLQQQLSDYFDSLAQACFQFRGREFWRLQKETLDELGCSIYDLRFARAIVAKLLELALNPKATTDKAVRRVKRRRDRG